MTGILIKRENLDTNTQRKNPCEDEDRDQSDDSTSQVISKIVRKLPEARGEAWN